jgi:DNA-binding transcriptional MocR family regulator
MIDLSGVQPDWSAEATAVWAEACHTAPPVARSMARPAYGGHRELREQIAVRYDLDADHVTIVASVRAAAWSLGHQHRECFVESPSFPGIPLMLKRAGSQVHRFSGLDVDPPQGSLVIVTHPGRNPDGHSLDASGRARLAELASRGVRIVVNETYREFAPAAPRVEGGEVMGSLHKIAGVGSRIGFATGAGFAADAVPELAAAEPPEHWQAVWAGFIARGGLDILRRDVVSPAIEAAEVFDGIRAEVVPQAHQGCHRLVALAADIVEGVAVQVLLAQGLQVVGGTPFDVTPPTIRLCFTGVNAAEAGTTARLLLGSGLLSDRRPAGSQ